MTRAGYVSIRVVDDTGKQLDSDVVLAHLYVTGSQLYNVVSALVHVGSIGELFALFRKEGFKVRFSREKCVFEAEHYSYPVRVILHPEEDGGFILEVVVPTAIEVSAERAFLGVWRALRALRELDEELSKLKERIGQLEDELRGQREELRGIREALRGFEEHAGGEGGGEEE